MPAQPFGIGDRAKIDAVGTIAGVGDGPIELGCLTDSGLAEEDQAAALIDLESLVPDVRSLRHERSRDALKDAAWPSQADGGDEHNWGQQPRPGNPSFAHAYGQTAATDDHADP